MFENLSPEQKIVYAEYKAKWIKIAECTEPADFPRAFAALTNLYKSHNHKLPQFVPCTDPDHANELINKELGNTKDNFTYYHTTLWGSLDSYWISFYLFCRDELKITFTPEQASSLDAWAELAQSCSFWYPFDTHCFVTERPAYININAEGQFDSNSEPALGYRSGWSLFSMQGTVMPEHAIMHPELITAKMIDVEKSVEIRRHMISQMGIGKYLLETDAKLIHTDVIRVGGEIDAADVCVTRALIADQNGRRYLVGSDSSTNRVYHMPVDPACNTCAEAHASISGGLNDADCLANG